MGKISTNHPLFHHMLYNNRRESDWTDRDGIAECDAGRDQMFVNCEG